MELNYFKDVLFDLVNESDRMGVLDMEADDENDTLLITMADRSRILVECRTVR